MYSDFSRSVARHNQRPKRRFSGGNSGGGNRRGPQKQDIHPSRFIKRAEISTDAEVYEPVHAFNDFEVHPLIKKNVENKGYVTPSPIQDKAIPVALTGKDIVGIADTGTGKTAAFAIPMLHKLSQERGAKALIIAPTRELAQQIESECRSFAQGSGVRGAVLIGGTSMSPQVRDLRARPSIIIGTPGRIKDHIERGTLDLSGFNVLVLDEVDRMLDMGFIGDIRFLLSKLNSNRQSFFFSATMDRKIEELIRSFSKDPVIISIKTSETSDNVNQDVVRYAGPSDKIDKLHNTLIAQPAAKILIFDDTRRSVEKLSKELQARGFKADAIHGGKSQGQRQRALAKFKQNEIDVLIATDVAARGIDVADITHVINYSQPSTYNDYIHRIGRAGRAGRSGQALTFVSGQ